MTARTRCRYKVYLVVTTADAYDRRMPPAATFPDPQNRPLLGADTPGVGQLFAVLLAGEYAACYRLIEESAMAPGVSDRIAIVRLIAGEVAHFESLAAELAAYDITPEDAVAAYGKVFDNYHRATTPKTWYEALVKMYIGDGLAADFYTELADNMDEHPRGVVRQVMSETGASAFARDRVRAAVDADPALKSPLTLWGRRLLGEAITHAQWVLAAEERLTDLLFAEAGSLKTVAQFFDAIAERHTQRMRDLGLG